MRIIRAKVQAEKVPARDVNSPGFDRSGRIDMPMLVDGILERVMARHRANTISHPKLGHVAAVAGFGLLFGLSGVSGLTAVTTPPPSVPTVTAAPVAVTAPKVKTFAAVGDSMVEHDVLSPTASNPWVFVAQEADLQYVGGFAQSGDKTYEVLAGMKATAPVTADVTVILAGRNDVTLIEDEPESWSIAQGIATIQQIAVQSGSPHILVSAIAPCGPDCDAYNTALATLAYQQGYGWVDPWTTLIDPSTDLYYPQDTVDGIHPTFDGYTVVGLAMREALLNPPHIFHTEPETMVAP